MSKFVITGITVENGEVVTAHVQKLRPHFGPGREGTAGLDEGELMDFPSIASLTLSDDVHVVKWIGPGEFELGSRVTRKPGQIEHLMSVDADGSPNDDLLNVALIR